MPCTNALYVMIIITTVVIIILTTLPTCLMLVEIQHRIWSVIGLDKTATCLVLWTCGNAARNLELQWVKTALPTCLVLSTCGNAARNLECRWVKTALPTCLLSHAFWNKISNVKFREFQLWGKHHILFCKGNFNGQVICKNHEILPDTWQQTCPVNFLTSSGKEIWLFYQWLWALQI